MDISHCSRLSPASYRNSYLEPSETSIPTPSGDERGPEYPVKKLPMFGPDGADGCSRGWSSPRANGTRGTVTAQHSRPGGAERGSEATLQSIEHAARLEIHIMDSQQ